MLHEITNIIFQSPGMAKSDLYLQRKKFYESTEGRKKIFLKTINTVLKEGVQLDKHETAMLNYDWRLKSILKSEKLSGLTSVKLFTMIQKLYGTDDSRTFDNHYARVADLLLLARWKGRRRDFQKKVSEENIDQN